MQTFLCNQKEDFFKENRLCHFEKLSKSPETPKEEPKKEPLKREEATREMAETLKPAKLTKEKARGELDRQKGADELYLNAYTQVDADALRLIADVFKGRAIRLDGLEEIDWKVGQALSALKVTRIYLRGVKQASFKDEDVCRELRKANGRIFNRYIAYKNGPFFRIYGYEPVSSDREYLSEEFKRLKYDFNGIGVSDGESRDKSVEEVDWILHKHKVSPLSIIWEEIFPEGANINFTGGKVTADTYNENLKVLGKVENWIAENL